MLVKYPRTPHLPHSLGTTNDDKILKSIDHFIGKTLLMTVKMDGENTTMTGDRVYARSLDSGDHNSRHWVKALWSQINFNIPNGWRICGENLYAKHSIGYDNLKSFFQVYSIWDESNNCLSWYDTVIWCELLGLTTVDVIFNNFKIENIDELHSIFLSKYPDDEGYVIRNNSGFSYDNFYHNVAKYVRENHVQTDSHWMFNSVEKNNLRI